MKKWMVVTVVFGLFAATLFAELGASFSDKTYHDVPLGEETKKNNIWRVSQHENISQSYTFTSYENWLRIKPSSGTLTYQNDNDYIDIYIDTSKISNVKPLHKYTATVKLTSTDPAWSTYYRTVTVWTAEEDSAIFVTPSSRDFGSIEIGSSSDKTFTVENIGGGDLVGSVSVSSPFSVVSGGSYDLSGGETKSVTVRFSPASEGAASKTASFSGGGGKTATVSGTGIAPPGPEVSAYVADKSFLLSEGEILTSNNIWHVRNIGDIGSSLTYSLGKVHESPLGGNSDWLTISPSSGSLTKSGSSHPIDYIDLTANAASLTSGIYICTVNLTCNDPVNPGPFPRTVTLTVDPPPGPDWDITESDFIELPPYEPGQYPLFSVTVKNIGNQSAPASKLKAESSDRDTGNDYYSALIDVPSLDVNEEVTLQVPVRVGAFTEILVPKFTANAENLSERNAANNESGIIIAVTRVKGSRAQGNTEEKTGFSGDPVNTATGNFVHHSTDLSIPSRSLDFSFTRYYNSQSAVVTSLGRGWRHSFMYEMDLINTNYPGVIYPDGHSDYWHRAGDEYLPHFPRVFGSFESVVSGWKLTQKDLTVYQFDSAGKITSYADKNGNAVSFSYSGADLVSVTDPAGRALSLTYSSGKLSEVRDWTGRDIDFVYSGDHLAQVTDAKNNTIGFGYDAGSRLDQITDQRGTNVLSLVYDSLGRATSQADGNGGVTAFEYDQPSAFSTRITGPLGHQTTHVHNESYQLLQVVDELGRTVSYTYDAMIGLRDSIEDKAGYSTDFDYDSKGNLLRTDYPDGTFETYAYNAKSLPISHVNQGSNTTTWAYDSQGNVTSEINELGFVRSWTYNGFGQKLVETDRTGAATTFTYDGAGRLTRVEDADGVGEEYGYDALWRRTTVADDRSNVTTTVYNSDDSVAEVQREIGSVQFTYDALGNLLTEQDANGNITTYEYDGNSKRTKEMLPNSLGTKVFVFDAANRLLSIVDGRGNVWTKVYYDDGRLHKEIDPLLNETVTTYDSRGNVLTQIDGSGKMLTYTYDSMNRRLTAKDGENNTASFEYGALGQKTRTVDPEGNETEYRYDSASRLSSVCQKGETSADDATTSYAYDNENRLRTVTDAESSVWENRYSSAGRRTKRIDGLSREVSFSYDDAGNLSQVTHPNADWETYAYDKNNRRVGLSYNDGRSATFAFDDSGNTTQVVDWTGTTTYNYDNVNRLVSVNDSYGKVVQYGYDLAGNRTSISYPTVGEAAYLYDARNGLQSVTDWDANTFSYSLDGAMRITGRIFPNGVSASYGYDNAGRLTSLVYAKDSSTLLSYALGLNSNGSPVSITSSGLPVAEAVYNKTLNYNHDAAHQMVSSGDSDYSYDSRGAMTEREQPAGLETDFEFSPDGMLKRYSSVDGTDVQNIFDSAKQRLSSTRNETETRYVLDRQKGMANVLLETSDVGSATRYFLHGDQTLAMYSNSGDMTHCYLSDPFGNVVALTDSSGGVTDTYRYDPSGQTIGSTGSTDNPYKFVGALGVMEEPAGLYFMRARYYDSEQGRFVSVDPVEGETINPATLHRYLYGINNSYTYADPHGEFVITGSLIALSAVSGVFDLGTYLFTADDANWRDATASFLGGASKPAVATAAFFGTGNFLAAGMAAGAVDEGLTYAFGELGEDDYSWEKQVSAMGQGALTGGLSWMGADSATLPFGASLSDEKSPRTFNADNNPFIPNPDTRQNHVFETSTSRPDNPSLASPSKRPNNEPRTPREDVKKLETNAKH